MHQIGVGVLGPVFRTYEPSEDRLVAVKVFHLDLTPELAKTLVDALDEVVRGRLAHPSIVSPIAAGLEDGVPYLAQEYVAAESLDVAMRHYAPAAPETALPFITQLGDAIDAAHEIGVVHGALHLRDIFVTPDEARATGFGMVRALEEVGLRGPIRRPYTAPEVISGRPWGPEADRFALAAIAYELLTGQRTAGTGEQVTGRLNAVADVDDREALGAVFATALGDAPETRYASAAGFVVALRSAISPELGPSAESLTAPVASASSVGSGVPATSGSGGSGTAGAEPGVSDLLAGLDLHPHAPDAEPERSEAALAPPSNGGGDEAGPSDEPGFAAERDVVGRDEDVADARTASPGGTEEMDEPTGTDLATLDRTLEQIEPLNATVADTMAPGGDVECDGEERVDPWPARESDPPEEALLPLEDAPADRSDVEALAVSARPMPAVPGEPGDDETAQHRDDDDDDGRFQPPPVESGGFDEPGQPGPGSMPVADDVSPEETSAWSPRAAVPIAVAIAVATLAAYVIALGLGSRDASLTPQPAPDFGGDQVLEPPVGGPDDATREWSEATVGGGETASRQADVPTALGAPPDAAAEPRVRTRPAAPPAGISPPREPAPGPAEPAAEVAPPRMKDRPVDEPAVPTGSGWLLVRTNPPGASVTIDGRARGETPLSLQDVPFGSHHVEVRHDGYETDSRDMSLSADAAVAALSVDLRRAPAPSGGRVAPRGPGGSVFVDSRPSGARVLLDDRPVGITPLLVSDVTPGGHRVRIDRDGYQIWVTTVDVPPSERVRVAASLDRLPRR